MKIGVLGGGQLSRMLALAGIPMGLHFSFYEPQKACCAASLGEWVQASYDDLAALEKFAQSVDLLTFENENIPMEAFDVLEKHQKIFPGKEILRRSQDRLLEKETFQALKIPTADFYQVNTKQELILVLEETAYPVILKSRRGGYDGKGQKQIYRPQDLETIKETDCQNAIVEKYVDYDREFSLIAVRNAKGETRFYDLCENRHKKGILFRTVNKMEDPLFNKARDFVDRILKAYDYVGVLAVEFFQENEQIFANEMAPRVHNSGHWTIEGAMTSQFENHLRAIIGWPPGRTDSLAYATMYNIIGDFPDKDKLMQYPELHIHDYEKSARPGRKIGHMTSLASHSHAYHKSLESFLNEHLHKSDHDEKKVSQ
jgi:5-(carboxyamino)imidazole ribonucleotide synthase